MTRGETLRRPVMGAGYDVFWEFASKRQKVYASRLNPGHLDVVDPVLANNRFTNTYRAADRVSQFLITDVIYSERRSWEDTFIRVLVFKLFNKIETWKFLLDELGDVSRAELFSGAIDEALADRARRCPIYSAAYIMPPPRNRTGPKCIRHLGLLRDMVADGAHLSIRDASTMAEGFDILASYQSIGKFLAYQFITDLNYTEYLQFSESEFVIPGPGALRGIRKCVADPKGLTPEEIIRVVMEDQETAFTARGLEWSDLWGRPLQLIDIQNLFCEVDKYTRVANPELSIHAPGKRIKQRYRRSNEHLTAWFPPKWGINGRISAAFVPRNPSAAAEQLSLL